MLVAHAHASRENVGDNAIVSEVQDVFSRAFRDCTVEYVSICMDDRRVTGEMVTSHLPLGEIHRIQQWSNTIGVLDNSSLLAIGGGELVCGALEFMMLIPLARILGTPTVLLGLGADANSLSNLTELYTKFALRFVNLIFVRDVSAARELRRLGVPEEKITHSADVVFGTHLGDLNVSRKRGLALILRSTQRSDRALTSERLDRIVRLVTELAREKELRVHLLPFVPYARDSDAVSDEVDEDPLFGLPYSDAALLDLVEEQIHDSVEVIKHSHAELTPQRVLQIFGECELVVSMRLHGLILSAMARTPFVAIDYADKIGRVMHEIDADRQVMSISVFDDDHSAQVALNTAIDAARDFDYSNIEIQRSRLNQMIEHLRAIQMPPPTSKGRVWRLIPAYLFLAANAAYFWLVRSRNPILLGLGKLRNRLSGKTA